MKENGYKAGNRKMKRRAVLLAAILLIAVLAAVLIKIMGKGSVWELKNDEEEAAESAEETGSVSEPSITSAPEEGLVRLAYDEAPGNMDIAINTSNYYLALNVFDRLVEIRQKEDGSSEIVPSLAKEWTVSKDGRTYSFTLRDDVVFSDGTKLTADDVRCSFTRLLTVPESEQTAFADMIQGADEVLAGEAKELSGITVTDDTHISITLKEPFPAYISMLGSPACSILSRKKTEEAGSSYGQDKDYIIGSGPYVLTEMDDKVCTLEYNPLYWGEEPSVKKAEMYVMAPAIMDREFRGGGLDLLDMDFINFDTASYYLDNEDFRERRTEKQNVEIFSIILNNAMSPLDDPRVRKAVQLAIDRKRIIDEVCGGYAELTDGIFPKGLIGYSEENQGWLQYDPEEAKRLVEAAGVKDGESVELILGSKASADFQKLIEIVQENLREAGLNAVTVIYDSESRNYLRRNGKAMSYLFQWIADYNDPDNFIYTIFGTEEAAKRYSSNYSNRQVIDRINAARHIEDEEKRIAEYRAIEKKMVQEEAVWVPLYSYRHVFIRGERLAGYTPYWAGWSDVVLKDMELK